MGQMNGSDREVATLVAIMIGVALAVITIIVFQYVWW